MIGRETRHDRRMTTKSRRRHATWRPRHGGATLAGGLETGVAPGAGPRGAPRAIVTAAMAGPPEFETFEHDADIGLRGRGATLAEAFANAGRALTAVLTETALVRETLACDRSSRSSRRSRKMRRRRRGIGDSRARLGL